MKKTKTTKKKMASSSRAALPRRESQEHRRRRDEELEVVPALKWLLAQMSSLEERLDGMDARLARVEAIEQDGTTTSPMKRRKTASTSTSTSTQPQQTQQTQQPSMLSLPYNVWVEVAKHVKLNDLFAFAMTCKEFREIQMELTGWETKTRVPPESEYAYRFHDETRGVAEKDRWLMNVSPDWIKWTFALSGTLQNQARKRRLRKSLACLAAYNGLPGNASVA